MLCTLAFEEGFPAFGWLFHDPSKDIQDTAANWRHLVNRPTSIIVDTSTMVACASCSTRFRTTAPLAVSVAFRLLLRTRTKEAFVLIFRGRGSATEFVRCWILENYYTMSVKMVCIFYASFLCTCSFQILISFGCCWCFRFRKREHFDALVGCILHLQQGRTNVKGASEHGHKVFQRGKAGKVSSGAFNWRAFMIENFWRMPWDRLAWWKRRIVVLVMQAWSVVRSQRVEGRLSIAGHNVGWHVVVPCHDSWNSAFGRTELLLQPLSGCCAVASDVPSRRNIHSNEVQVSYARSLKFIRLYREENDIHWKEHGYTNGKEEKRERTIQDI